MSPRGMEQRNLGGRPGPGRAAGGILTQIRSHGTTKSLKLSTFQDSIQHLSVHAAKTARVHD